MRSVCVFPPNSIQSRRLIVMPRARRYPVELLERGARLMFESGRPIAHVAAELGLPSETLRKYVRRSPVEADEDRRRDLRSS